jgi:hypothetical protein
MIQFATGWDLCNDVASVSQLCNVSGTINLLATSGRGGGRCVELTQAGNGASLKIGVPAQPTICVGAAFCRPSGVSVYEKMFLTFLDGFNVQIACSLLPDLGMQVRRGSTVITTIPGPILHAGKWDYVEVQVTIHNVSGLVVVRANGLEVGRFEGPTQAYGSQISAVGLHCERNAGSNLLVDDVYVTDQQPGGATGFLGDTRVVAVLPAGAGSYTEWEPSPAGPNWACVDDMPHDGDATYVSGVTGQTDTYIYGALPELAASVHAIVMRPICRTDGPAGTQVAAVAAIGDQVYEGGLMSPADEYAFGSYIWQQNPATGQAWSPDDLEHAQFGLRVKE